MKQNLEPAYDVYTWPADVLLLGRLYVAFFLDILTEPLARQGKRWASRRGRQRSTSGSRRIGSALAPPSSATNSLAFACAHNPHACELLQQQPQHRRVTAKECGWVGSARGGSGGARTRAYTHHGRLARPSALHIYKSQHSASARAADAPLQAECACASPV